MQPGLCLGKQTLHTLVAGVTATNIEFLVSKPFVWSERKQQYSKSNARAPEVHIKKKKKIFFKQRISNFKVECLPMFVFKISP